MSSPTPLRRPSRIAVQGANAKISANLESKRGTSTKENIKEETKPKKKKDLKDRLISLSIIITVLSVCLPSVKGTYGMGLCMLGKCWDEYIRIVRPSSSVGFRLVLIAIAVCIAATGYYSRSLMTEALLVGSILTLLGVMCTSKTKSVDASSNTDTSRVFTEICLFVFGQFYMSWLGFGHMGLLTRHHMTMHTNVVIFTGFGETAALVFGKRFGRTKFWPALSPNKTTEGVTAQLVTSVVMSVLFCIIMRLSEGNIPKHWTVVDFALLGVIGGITGTVGDLFESLIKRSYSVKDMGGLLPGVGGILDRVDGLLFAMPAVYYYSLYRGAFVTD